MGRTWIVWDGDTAAASVTIHPSASPYLWTDEERRTPAIYLHRLVLERTYAGIGLGARLIAWAGQRGFHENPEAVWIRIDTWTDNHDLHKYYERQGFEFVAVRQAPGQHPSGRLFQKPIYQALVADTSGLVRGHEPSARTIRHTRPGHGHGTGGRTPAACRTAEMI